MKFSILGLHHVTATVDAAQPDLNFCVDALGLRLLKQTVNFDNHHVYHFYYGTGQGAPGTVWTTFPYRGHGVPVGRHGAGQIGVTSFSVPAGSLDFWRARLKARGIAVRDVPATSGEESIIATDPSGLAIALIANGRDTRASWQGGGIEPDTAVRGLHSVSLLVRSPAATVDFFTRVLGFERVAESGDRIRLAARDNTPGKLVDINPDPDAPAAQNGLGTVHHVAFAVADADEQLDLRHELIRLGHKVTEVRDRQYFTSIYFREPGGVLLEVATVSPGFTADEPLDSLGQSLKLPPWEEEYRADIERGLAPIAVPTPARLLR
jgi:glyoxalase family protein